MTSWNLTVVDESANEEVEDDSMGSASDPLAELNQLLEEIQEAGIEDEARTNGDRRATAGTPLLDEATRSDVGSSDAETPDEELNTPPAHNPVTPSQLPCDDDPPPSYESLTTVSSLYNNGNQFNLPACADIGATSAGQPRAIGYQPWVTIELDSWRVRASGMTWNVLRFFVQQGHPGVTRDVMRHLYYQIPLVERNSEALAIVVASIQTLATVGNGEFVMHSWAQRAGRAVPNYPTRPDLVIPQIRPWDLDTFWGYDVWGLIVIIMTQFLAQPTPATESAFLDTIRGCYVSAGPNTWVVRLTTHVAYFIMMAPWSWNDIFRQ